MSVNLHEEASGKILVVKLTGKLTKEDYEQFTPEVERLVKQHGKLRILVQMHEFHGWSAGAVWQDIKFDLKHFRDIERLALVGEKSWEHGMAVFCKPFTAATIRYFNRDEADQAETWIHAGLLVARRSGSAASLAEAQASHTPKGETAVHSTSEMHEWFLNWLDRGNGKIDDEDVTKLQELRSCTDEFPDDYCEHGRLERFHLPFGISYGVAAQKILDNKS